MADLFTTLAVAATAIFGLLGARFSSFGRAPLVDSSGSMVAPSDPDAQTINEYVGVGSGGIVGDTLGWLLALVGAILDLVTTVVNFLVSEQFLIILIILLALQVLKMFTPPKRVDVRFRGDR